jgi:hypothetical protein
MKYIVLIVLFFLYSCATDIDPSEYGHNVPVVYAIINTSDSVHYVRISKTFVGNFPATEMAQNENTLLYTEELDVRLNVLNRGNAIMATYPFHKVFLQKDSTNSFGNEVFTLRNHHVYELRDKLLEGEKLYYELTIIKPDGQRVYSKILPLFGFEHRHPEPGTTADIVNSSNSKFGCSFFTPTGIASYSINFYFYFYETKRSGVLQKKRITINSGILRTRPSSDSLRISSYTFYSSLLIKAFREGIDSTDNSVNGRFLGKIAIEYKLADTILTEYILNRTSTLNDETVPLNNIVNGVGIFASRINSEVRGILSSHRMHAIFFERLNNQKFKHPDNYVAFYATLPDSLH